MASGRLTSHHECDCARCRGVSTANKQYGFDEAKVAKTLCLHCEKPIGDRSYFLVTFLARFGQMFFEHADCHFEHGDPKAVPIARGGQRNEYHRRSRNQNHNSTERES